MCITKLKKKKDEAREASPGKVLWGNEAQQVLKYLL